MPRSALVAMATQTVVMGAFAVGMFAVSDAPQTCRTDDGIRTCAPSWAPSGASLVGSVEEDGSARYADGQTFDAEQGWS